MANTPAHVTSATLGHTSASSVLNETFMSNKKSLDKQDKLDFISFNLDLERDFNVFFVKSEDVTMSMVGRAFSLGWLED